MESLRGTVSHCQHTVDITGGSRNNNTGTSTTYVTLFRVNNRPIEFRTGRPISVSDGDQVVVAGVLSRTNALRAYACRNITTGEITNAGLLSSVFALVLIPAVLCFITFVAVGMFGKIALLGGIVLIALAMAILLRQIVLTQQAASLVRD